MKFEVLVKRANAGRPRRRRYARDYLWRCMVVGYFREDSRAIISTPIGITVALTRHAGFVPITNTYNSGSGNETIPSGSQFLTCTADGGGGGGAEGTSSARGGGGSARCIITNRPVLPAEWGTNLAYVVGAVGVGKTGGTGNGTSGTASTITGTINGGALNMSAGGGAAGQTGGAGGGGGTASGGDTNTSGSSTTTGTGGTAASGALGSASEAQSPGAAPGAGGGNGLTVSPSNGSDGGAARIVFAWT